MIQAIGLTSLCRRGGEPAVDDLTFEASPGAVTGLFGVPGAGKSTALRLMLGLQPGRGVALFDGRPMHRVRHPAREVGVLLGDVPGNPTRTALGHLQMLAAAAGVPASRADEALELVGLTGVAKQRLEAFSLGMDRRLGLAAALLGDPHVLVLDEPAAGLSPREASWVHSLLREFADQGGTVLMAGDDAKEMAAHADHVVSIDRGRLVADQPAVEFARTRLRPRVVVRSPQARQLAHLLAAQGVEVSGEGGSCVAVFGAGRAHVGETAFRHGIMLHELAEQVVDAGLPPAQRTASPPPEALAGVPGGAPAGSRGAAGQGRVLAGVGGGEGAGSPRTPDPLGAPRIPAAAPGPKAAGVGPLGPGAGSGGDARDGASPDGAADGRAGAPGAGAFGAGAFGDGREDGAADAAQDGDGAPDGTGATGDGVGMGPQTGASAAPDGNGQVQAAPGGADREEAGGEDVWRADPEGSAAAGEESRAGEDRAEAAPAREAAEGGRDEDGRAGEQRGTGALSPGADPVDGAAAEDGWDAEGGGRAPAGEGSADAEGPDGHMPDGHVPGADADLSDTTPLPVVLPAPAEGGPRGASASVHARYEDGRPWTAGEAASAGTVSVGAGSAGAQAEGMRSAGQDAADGTDAGGKRTGGTGDGATGINGKEAGGRAAAGTGTAAPAAEGAGAGKAAARDAAGAPAGGRRHAAPREGARGHRPAAAEARAGEAGAGEDARMPPLPGPTWLLRYEWRRLTGIRSTWLTAAVALTAGLLVTLLLGRTPFAASRHEDMQRLLTAWAPGLPLPPAAFGAGLLGALAFGQEFRYPALAPAQVAVARRMRLLLAKMAVAAATGLALAAVTLVLHGVVVRYGVNPPGEAVPAPVLPLLLWWTALVVGSAWAGLLAAGVFRSSLVGALCVLAVPVLVEPVVRRAIAHPLLDPTLDLARHAALAVAGGWEYPLRRAADAVHVLAAGPVEYAYALSVLVLLVAYTVLTVRRRTGWRFPG